MLTCITFILGVSSAIRKLVQTGFESPEPTYGSTKSHLRRELRYVNRVNPSALQSSLPTPWCTKNNPSGSYLSLIARSFG